MTTTLITGANRGIGLEHTKQALAAGESVIATCRHVGEATALQELANAYPDAFIIEECEVTSQASVDALAGRLSGRAIDILINNAGYMGEGAWSAEDPAQALASLDYGHWQKVLDINLFGPCRVTAAFLPNLRLGDRKLVIMMSSDLASIEGNTMGGTHAYRTSKTALNMLSKGLAIDLAKQGITVVPLTPGWTKTDLGGEHAHWDVDESVKRQREVIAGLTVEDSGKFYNLEGKILPW